MSLNYLTLSQLNPNALIPLGGFFVESTQTIRSCDFSLCVENVCQSDFQNAAHRVVWGCVDV